MSLQADIADGQVRVNRWDVGTLAWIAWDGSLTTGALTIGTVSIAGVPIQLTPASGTVANSGNNTLITPAAGKKLRVYYLSYNPSAAVLIAFRFGAAGTQFIRNDIASAGAIVSKDFGDFRFVQGATDEALILNLGGAVSTLWNAFYVEVT